MPLVGCDDGGDVMAVRFVQPDGKGFLDIFQSAVERVIGIDRPAILEIQAVCHPHGGIGVGVIRIERDRALERGDRLLEEIAALVGRPQQFATLQEGVVRLGIAGAAGDKQGLLLRRQSDLERGDDLGGHLVLDGKDVGEVAVVALRPEVPAGIGIDQLRRDPHPVAGAADAALEHGADAEFASDGADIDVLALVDEARVARDDHQPADFGQVGDDVLADAVGEILLFGIARHVGERQDRDRWCPRRGLWCSGRRGRHGRARRG